MTRYSTGPSRGGALAFIVATALGAGIPTATVQAAPTLELVREFPVPEANQAVGVDDRHFYAIDNRTIAKYDKTTGERVGKWEGPKDGPILHLDSAKLMNGRLYAAHSNYPQWPMTSSLEVFDAQTLEPVESHSFGILYGSLTWIDWKDDHWWMTFANYDRPFSPDGTRYGNKLTTQMVKMTRDFVPVGGWTLPKALLDRFEDMSNSGGEWGPDGYLYLSGHDPAELYRMRLPKQGSVLELVDIIPMPIRGQGFAWDWSKRDEVYGIIRATKAERSAGGTHRVTVSRLVDK